MAAREVTRHGPSALTTVAQPIAEMAAAAIEMLLERLQDGDMSTLGSENERKSLRGAARAQQRTGLPLAVHMPGWFRRGPEVLDIVAEEGGDLNHTILCHMNPSGVDFEYQAGIAERGAFLEYDMVGMDFYYADQEAQSPCDEENAFHIARLVKNGYGHKVLISHDVFLKMMYTRHGGFGYGYIPRHFVPRLRRHGLSDDQTKMLLTGNPEQSSNTPDPGWSVVPLAVSRPLGLVLAARGGGPSPRLPWG